MAESKPRDMRLKIVACRQVYSGRNTRGDSYTIYEIDAERASDGHRIGEKLRSFQALPMGQVVDVTVTPFYSERHGRSYTLALKGGRTSGAVEQQNGLQEQIDLLTENLGKLANRVKDLESRLGGGVPPQSPQTAPPSSAELDAKFGAEPPGGATW